MNYNKTGVGSEASIQAQVAVGASSDAKRVKSHKKYHNGKKYNHAPQTHNASPKKTESNFDHAIFKALIQPNDTIDKKVRKSFDYATNLRYEDGQPQRKDRALVAGEIAAALSTIPKDIDKMPQNTQYVNDFSTQLQGRSKHYGIRPKNDKNGQPIPTEKRLINKSPRSYFDIWKVLQRLYGNKIALHANADLDAQAAFFLLKVCGFTKNDTQFLQLDHEEIKPGYLHLDTGGQNGIKVVGHKEKDSSTLMNSSVIIDHHKSIQKNGKYFHGASSTTQMVYTLLKTMHRISPQYKGQMERFVKFVNIVDSAGYEIAGRDYDNLHKTMFGLQRLILNRFLHRCWI